MRLVFFCASTFVLAISLSAAEGDRKTLIGTWRGGFPDDKNPRYELVITEEKISGTNIQDGKSLGEGSWVLDEEKKTIDATMLSDRRKGTVYQGIYKVDGDSFKWASDNGSKRRPTDLVHKPGQSFLMVMTRQK